MAPNFCFHIKKNKTILLNCGKVQNNCHIVDRYVTLINCQQYSHRQQTILTQQSLKHNLDINQ